MGTRLKAASLLLLVVLLGFAAGAVVTGALYRERAEYVASFTSPDGFVGRFLDLIGPLTDEQEQQVMPLLTQAGKDIDELVATSAAEFQSTITQLIDDLSVHLTDEQLVELNEKRMIVRNRYIERHTVFRREDLSEDGQ